VLDLVGDRHPPGRTILAISAITPPGLQRTVFEQQAPEVAFDQLDVVDAEFGEEAARDVEHRRPRAYVWKARSNSGHQSGSTRPGGRGDRGGGFRGPPPSLPPGSSARGGRRAMSPTTMTTRTGMRRAMAGGASADMAVLTRG
jgi:hypothetical protein